MKCLKIKVSDSLMGVSENFVKIICIGLDILTWLIANPFVAYFDTSHRGS